MWINFFAGGISAESILTHDQIREDCEYLLKTLEDVHPAAFGQRSREEIAKCLDSVVNASAKGIRRYILNLLFTDSYCNQYAIISSLIWRPWNTEFWFTEMSSVPIV